MKNGTQLTLVLLCLLLTTVCAGQPPFRNCTAAFLGSTMLVNEYTPKGVCRVPAKATGNLTVNTVNLSATASKAVAQIPFKIAIRDKATQTIVLYSNDTFRQVAIQKVLTRCKKGDHIMLLTLDDQYSLPHNELVVQ